MKTITLLALTFFVGLTGAFASSNDDTPNAAKNEAAAVKKYCYLKAVLRSLDNNDTYVYSNVLEVISQEWTILKNRPRIGSAHIRMEKVLLNCSFQISSSNSGKVKFIIAFIIG